MTSSVIGDAFNALVAAVSGIPGVRIYSEPGDIVSPPGVMVSPPTLGWAVYAEQPDTATFTVWLIADFSERPLEALFPLVPAVSEAIDVLNYMAVTTAAPATISNGGTDYPCYQFTVEASLT